MEPFVKRRKIAESSTEIGKELAILPGNLPPEIFKLVVEKITGLKTANRLLAVNKEVAKWTEKFYFDKVRRIRMKCTDTKTVDGYFYLNGARFRSEDEKLMEKIKYFALKARNVTEIYFKALHRINLELNERVMEVLLEKGRKNGWKVKILEWKSDIMLVLRPYERRIRRAL